MFNPQIVRQQIENLKIQFPQLLDDEETWLSALESETSMEELLSSIVRQIDDAAALVAGTKERFDMLTARKQRFEHRIEALRELAYKIMHTAEVPKVVLPEATLSLRAGQQQLVGDADPKDLPDNLCRISRDLDKTAIKTALKDGVTIPGFQLSNSQPTLSIRIK